MNAAGLATLTHTPSPMGFLRDILGRPCNEKAFVLIPVGYPAEGCRVPDLGKKALGEVMILTCNLLSRLRRTSPRAAAATGPS